MVRVNLSLCGGVSTSLSVCGNGGCGVGGRKGT
jgi:hypothetical protein